MIDSLTIETAEARLTYKSGLEVPTLAAQFSRARVLREPADMFIGKQMETLHKHSPDLDPRYDSALATMMLHCFLTGVMSARTEEK